MDDDCDGEVDEGVKTTWYKDTDNDGYSDGTSQVACSRPSGYKTSGELTSVSGDCDDNNDALNPATVWYRDADDDGYSDGATLTQCTQPAQYKLKDVLVSSLTDCNDGDRSISPGATEICNSIDDDCDGLTDEGCTGLITWYRDADKDGYGNPNPAFIKIQATKPRNYVANNLDCRDFDATAYPGAPEIGDGIDNNCNGLVDEGLDCLKTWYYDGDGDGYGSDDYTRLSCIQHNNYVPMGGDCKNWDGSVYPGATEICDGKDNDCDGAIDEGCTMPVITEVQKPVNPAKPLARVDGPVLEVSLWPNPARDVLMVSLDAFETGKKLDMVLIQADGKPVASQSLIPAVKGQQVRFDVRAMSAGYYLLRVKQDVNQQTKKLLVLR